MEWMADDWVTDCTAIVQVLSMAWGLWLLPLARTG